MLFFFRPLALTAFDDDDETFEARKRPRGRASRRVLAYWIAATTIRLLVEAQREALSAPREARLVAMGARELRSLSRALERALCCYYLRGTNCCCARDRSWFLRRRGRALCALAPQWCCESRPRLVFLQQQPKKSAPPRNSPA